MFRTLSPSGAPIQFGDLLYGIKAELRNDDSIEIFTEQVSDYLRCKDIYLLSSGKAALSLVLKVLASVSERREVIIPAYSSFCLASAVAASGLSVKLCDIDLKYLDFDLDHLSMLVDEKTLAVIPVHLFGLVARLDEILAITKAKGAYLVEDAAQAAGAKHKGKYVGTIGDAGIFSLGRGKSISTVHGGIIAVKNRNIANIIEKKIKKLPHLKALEKLNILLSAIAICFLLRPTIYFIPVQLPFLKLGANEYDPNFKSLGFSNLQAGFGKRNFRRLDSYNRKRVENAQFLVKRLRNNESIQLPKVAAKGQPCFTRFPLYFLEQRKRDEVYAAFLRAGLGASKNFPCSLNQIGQFKDCILNSCDDFSNSQKICNSLLTLPTHHFVCQDDLVQMANILS